MRKEIFRFPGEMLINYFLGLWYVLRKFSVETPTDLNNKSSKSFEVTVI